MDQYFVGDVSVVCGFPDRMQQRLVTEDKGQGRVIAGREPLRDGQDLGRRMLAPSKHPGLQLPKSPALPPEGCPSHCGHCEPGATG